MFLALREIARNRGRFTLLGGAVGLLVVLLLFFQTVAGALTSALTGALANQTAEVVVYGERARQNPLASVLPEQVVDAVAEVEGVAEAAGVVQAPTTGVGPGGTEVDVVVVGIEPGAPGTPSRVEGELPRSGQALASGSGFDTGFPVGATVEVGPDRTSVEVVGQAVEASANASPTLYVPRSDVGTLVGGQGRGGMLSWVGVRPADGVEADALAMRITDQVDGVEALTRAAAVDALPGVGTITQSFGILYGLLYIVVTIVTGVFFLILTVQKRDALVLLRAVGARRRDVVVPVLVQVVLVVGIGALIGSGITAGLLQAAQDTFGGGLSATTAATSSGVILVLGLVAASAAVRRVLAIEPAEATMSGGLE